MEVRVVCSDECKRSIEEILKRCRIKSSQEAKYTIVEKGFSIPYDSTMLIIFNKDDIGLVEQFFKDMERSLQSIDNNYIACKTEKGYELVNIESVIRFETNAGITYCITSSKTYEINGRFYELEGEYRSKGLVRISRHCIVNIKHIKEIIPWFGSKLLLKLTDKTEIDVTRGYIQQFKEYINLR